jgi:hypothetical protein
MEVNFNPETEKKLKDLASQSGRGTDDLVEDAMAGYVAELLQAREMLDSRYDDLKSDRVKPTSAKKAPPRVVRSPVHDGTRQRIDPKPGTQPGICRRSLARQTSSRFPVPPTRPKNKCCVGTLRGVYSLGLLGGKTDRELPLPTYPKMLQQGSLFLVSADGE